MSQIYCAITVAKSDRTLEKIKIKQIGRLLMLTTKIQVDQSNGAYTNSEIRPIRPQTRPNCFLLLI